MAKHHSKRYNSAIKVADLTKDYPLKEAVEILAKFPKAKFDETVELSFSLGVDAASGEQNVRGTTPLPNGSGKKVRVIVFTDDAPKAIAAGADEAGLTDLMKKVSDGWLEFDVAIATTEAMLARAKVNKGGRPFSQSPRKLISLRLPANVIEKWKATGPGWQTRMAERLSKVR